MWYNTECGSGARVTEALPGLDKDRTGVQAHPGRETVLLEFCMRLNREPEFDRSRDRIALRDLT